VKRVLFVSNGHGEEAIAARIAQELPPARLAADHLALVGEFGHPSVMRDVGPRGAMPSGGLIAMGNMKNIARDVRGGLIGHTFAQLRFLGREAGMYDATVAVGDVFALWMALRARRPTVFVGTAKSVHLAPYGRFEERVITNARAVFVRDEPTAERLRLHGIDARAANVIVDLQNDESPGFDLPAYDPLLGLFPGSRASAYDDAVFLTRVTLEAAKHHPGMGGMLSIAPGLEVHRFAQRIANGGMRVTGRDDAVQPFAVRDGDREVVRAFRGPIGAIIARSKLVLGQAGTANEAAASAGIPVIAFELGEKKSAWYRMRQAALLGDALLVVPGRFELAVHEVQALLRDETRYARMSAAGRQRMGSRGAARTIANTIAEIVQAGV